jgi:hypothetical protein
MSLTILTDDRRRLIWKAGLVISRSRTELGVASELERRVVAFCGSFAKRGAADVLN